MKFVLDASLTLAWFFDDEATPETNQLQDVMADGAQAICPAHWPAEVANGLLVAERRTRIPASKTAQFLGMLSHFLIVVEPATPGGVNTPLPLAREYGLTAYDAAYLEIAMRLGAPIGTLDGALRRSAQEAGLTLLPTTITSASRNSKVPQER